MYFHLPAFPVNVFPESLARYIQNVAEAIVCPPDFVGTMMLGVLSSAIGSSRTIKVKEGWHEPPVLYLTIVASPSSKKSPAFKQVLAPVLARQREMHENYRHQQKNYEYELEVWEEQKGGGPRPEKPRLARNYFTDSTIEALARLLADNPKGLLLGIDELVAWVKSMNQYRKGSDREHWLSLWTCGMITVDRASREEPIIVSNPFVSVTGGVQPDRLKVFKGEEHDGFIDRILFSFPEEMPNRWSEVTVSKILKQEYADLYESLYQLQPESLAEGGQRPICLPFSPSAKKAFIRAVNLNNEDINHEGHPFLKSAFGKLEAYLARFALILQLTHDPDSHQVETEAVIGAIQLQDYFKGHLRKVYAHLEEREVDSKLIRALEAMKSHGGPMTLRECYTKKVAGVKTSAKARVLFKELQEGGFGRLFEVQNPSGGRPTLSFHLKTCSCESCNRQSNLRIVK